MKKNYRICILGENCILDWLEKLNFMVIDGQEYLELSSTFQLIQKHYLNLLTLYFMMFYLLCTFIK